MIPKGQVFSVIDQLRRKLRATKLLKSWLTAYILFIVQSIAENNKEEKRKGGTQQLLEYPPQSCEVNISKMFHILINQAWIDHIAEMDRELKQQPRFPIWFVRLLSVSVAMADNKVIGLGIYTRKKPSGMIATEITWKHWEICI